MVPSINAHGSRLSPRSKNIRLTPHCSPNSALRSRTRSATMRVVYPVYGSLKTISTACSRRRGMQPLTLFHSMQGFHLPTRVFCLTMSYPMLTRCLCRGPQAHLLRSLISTVRSYSYLRRSNWILRVDSDGTQTLTMSRRREALSAPWPRSRCGCTVSSSYWDGTKQWLFCSTRSTLRSSSYV